MIGPTRSLALTAFYCVAVAAPAAAHTGIGGHSYGLAAGFLHPLMGLDHLLAMIGIGLWATQLGRRAIWLVPTAFVTVMLAGAALALAGAALPLVEFGIAGSVLAIGALIVAGARMPVGSAMGLAGIFALFHGYAHGTELPGFAQPVAYGLGFAAATALLHGAGIAIGYAVRSAGAKPPLRIAGAAIAAAGGGLLLAA